MALHVAPNMLTLLITSLLVEVKTSFLISGGWWPVYNLNYHFTWRYNSKNFSCPEAWDYCSTLLGPQWSPISIDSVEEDYFIAHILKTENVKYSWTSGRLFEGVWRWALGDPVKPINWSHTGGSNVPQPDNREGNEICLAVLNNFYGDGVRWHDVAPHHMKPVICEKNV